MSDMKVSLPDTATEWIEARVREGGYADAGDYLRSLIDRDRVRQASELTLEELRRHVATSRASGAGRRSLDDLFLEAERIAAAIGKPGELLPSDATGRRRSSRHLPFFNSAIRPVSGPPLQG